MPQTTPDPDVEPTGPIGPTRRVVLRAVTVSAAGAALLAACGGDDTSGAAEPTPTGAGAGSEETSAEATGAAGGALVATADVPVGGGVILEEKKVVVTQPAEGEFKAFTAVCTHQSCTVASVKDDRISCACHGSAFSAADGSVVNGPATRPLRAIPVAVEGDEVVEA